jgi:hypothetical protein
VRTATPPAEHTQASARSRLFPLHICPRQGLCGCVNRGCGHLPGDQWSWLGFGNDTQACHSCRAPIHQINQIKAPPRYQPLGGDSAAARASQTSKRLARGFAMPPRGSEGLLLTAHDRPLRRPCGPRAQPSLRPRCRAARVPRSRPSSSSSQRVGLGMKGALVQFEIHSQTLRQRPSKLAVCCYLPAPHWQQPRLSAARLGTGSAVEVAVGAADRRLPRPIVPCRARFPTMPVSPMQSRAHEELLACRH